MSTKALLRKKTGPFEVSFVIMARTIINGDSKSKPSVEPKISIKRFKNK